MNGWQYPHGYLWKNKFFVVHSVNKEDVALSVFETQNTYDVCGRRVVVIDEGESLVNTAHEPIRLVGRFLGLGEIVMPAHYSNGWRQ